MEQYYRDDLKKNYYSLHSLKDIFKVYGNGLTTAHDEFVISSNKDDLIKKFLEFKKSERNDKYLHENFKVAKKEGWSILKAWDKFQNLYERDIAERVVKYTYRPFDAKYIIYDDSVVWRTVRNVMAHFDKINVGLITGRAGLNVLGDTWNLCFITNSITDFNVFSRGGGMTFPLYLLGNSAYSLFANTLESNGKIENISIDFRKFWTIITMHISPLKTFWDSFMQYFIAKVIAINTRNL